MENWNNKLLAEEKEVSTKWLQEFLKKFKKPEVLPSVGFSDQMKRKLNKKIQEKKEAQERIILANIPNFAKWRFRLTGFVTAISVFFFIFILSFFTDFFSHTIAIPSKYTKVELFSFPETGEVSPETDGIAAKQAPVFETLLMEMVGKDETEEIGYLYDGKKYPKIAQAMPVYKRVGALVNEGILNKALKSLKFGDVALKAFDDIHLENLQFWTSGHFFSIQATNGILSIRDNAEAEMGDIGDLAVNTVNPSAKEITKNIEKQLKSLGIPLAGYGKIVIGTETEHYRSIFIPQLINGYPLWNALGNEQIGIRGSYNLMTNQISLNGVDIAQYEYVNYPTLPKEEILKDFTLGMKKLNAPEIVYLRKSLNDEVYYVPGLRFIVDEEKAVYKELVKF